MKQCYNTITTDEQVGLKWLPERNTYIIYPLKPSSQAFPQRGFSFTNVTKGLSEKSIRRKEMLFPSQRELNDVIPGDEQATESSVLEAERNNRW